MQSDKSLTAKDFTELFGVNSTELPAECIEVFGQFNWNYRELTGTEKESVILDLLKRIENRDFSQVLEGDKSRWNKGWQENLTEFRTKNGSLETLVPKYFKPGKTLRLRQKYISTEDPQFEFHWFEVYRRWLFLTFLSGYDKIYEFGCGSGVNLAN